MSVNQPALEALGDHDYLVRCQQDEDTVVVRVHADPAVVVQIADDEQRVVEATAAYLIARQSADDLPEGRTLGSTYWTHCRGMLLSTRTSWMRARPGGWV